jgi:hypothetical protein
MIFGKDKGPDHAVRRWLRHPSKVVFRFQKWPPPSWVALHIRVIALENLVIFLLAAASDQQLELAREMAPYISPRPGFTPHPLTTHAVVDMIDLLERASRSCSAEPS